MDGSEPMTQAPPGAPTHLAFVAARLHDLCSAAGFGDDDVAAAEALLHVLLAPWGDAPIAAPSFPSDLSDDHFPVELSLALDGDVAEVRVLLEAPPPGASPTAPIGAVARAQWEAGVALGRRIEDAHRGVALGRFNDVAPLFVPTDDEARWGVWHAVCLRSGRAPRFKLYVNPQAQGRA